MRWLSWWVYSKNLLFSCPPTDYVHIYVVSMAVSCQRAVNQQMTLCHVSDDKVSYFLSFPK